ncbi:hypothetical protein SUGI_0298910 [Cryptomeria japonica]|uniref:transcription factor MYB106 n=1 Tax=Cryptomeria japonica TaxID=3369 RepID=UPI002408ACFA|nr:transcription factor MYB106 [Cryptomeria japonica]GLJ17243.1 hypothetical protein SUGI_0298910 [Cryptomeria japonica]
MAEKKNSVDGLNRGAWQPEEDLLLKTYVEANGAGRWSTLASKAGLKRCGKSCRLRWMNYLRPNVKRGHITPDEADLIIRLHKLLGNRWSLIAARVPGRSDNDVKNFWNIHLSKKSGRKGVHLNTHKSKLKDTPSPNTNSIGDSTKDEIDSKCSTNFNFQPDRLSMQRDSILGSAEPKMLQNPCKGESGGRNPCPDESTKPRNGHVLQHVIAPTKCNLNTASYTISSVENDELHSAVYKFSPPLTTLVQQNSHGFLTEISDSMQGLTTSNQYHPHSDSFGFGFVPGLESNYIFDSVSCSTNLQPNNLNSQLEYHCKAEPDGQNPCPDEFTMLRNGLVLQHVITPTKPNLNTASYNISSVENDELHSAVYKFSSPLTTLIQQNSHGFLSDISYGIQGLTNSTQYHSHSDAFGFGFVPGFDSTSSFTNLQRNNVNL